MKENFLSRRKFIGAASMAAAAIAMPVDMLGNADIKKQWNSKKKSGFTMWQIPSHRNTIGNSYVFRTNKGKVIVMDGGFKEEEPFMRGIIGALGNEVEAWFISHPHNDHMGALNEILKDPQDLKIKNIYHSKVSESVRLAEKDWADLTMEFYNNLDNCKFANVVDIRELGQTFDFDDMHLKILGVANEFTENAYNNSSMIMRVWDKKKSIVFLGDAGVECGNKVLASKYKDDLDCEYMQMAHHGQNGCDEHFYQTVTFRACLWPTPKWVWNNDAGKGFNTHILKTIYTRNWMKAKGITEHHVTCEEGLFKLD